MNITYHPQAARYLITYTEITITDWLRDLIGADYELRFGAETFFGERYAAITAETDTVGATFLVTPAQALLRPFYRLEHLHAHGLDCLPWYQVQGRAWTITVTPEGEGRQVTVPSKTWRRLETAQTLKEFIR